MPLKIWNSHPREVKEYYPDITDQEWQASTRLSTLLLLLFEKSVKEKFLEKPDKEVKPVLALYEI